MVCDILRSHYLGRVRLRQNSDKESYIRWYQAAPGAQALPLWHAFGSAVWEGPPTEPVQGCGELQPNVEWRPRKYPAPPGDHYHGEEEWFRTGVPEGAIGQVPADEACGVPQLVGVAQVEVGGWSDFDVTTYAVAGRGGVRLGAGSAVRVSSSLVGRGGVRLGATTWEIVGRVVIGGGSIAAGGAGAAKPGKALTGRPGLRVGGAAVYGTSRWVWGPGRPGLRVGAAFVQHPPTVLIGRPGLRVGGTGRIGPAFPLIGRPGLRVGGTGYFGAAKLLRGGGGLRTGAASLFGRGQPVAGGGGVRVGGGSAVRFASGLVGYPGLRAAAAGSVGRGRGAGLAAGVRVGVARSSWLWNGSIIQPSQGGG